MVRRRSARIAVRRRFFCRTMSSRRGAPEADTTGAVPPPRPQQVEWKTAIRCAVLVAGIAAVLSLVAARVELVSPLSWLWTISGSIITLALYQRRRPLAWMDAGVGARIGVVVGLALVACLAVAWPSAGWWLGMGCIAWRVWMRS